MRDFCKLLLADGQYNLALSWTAFPEAQINPVEVIQSMIITGNIEGALRHIAERGLADHFPPKDLISEMILNENFTGAQRWIGKFDLEAQFPVQFLMERALQAGYWDFALQLLSSNSVLKSTHSGKSIMDRVIEKGDWVSAIRLATTQMGLPSSSSPQAPLNPALKNLVRIMIQAVFHQTLNETSRGRLQ